MKTTERCDFAYDCIERRCGIEGSSPCLRSNCRICHPARIGALSTASVGNCPPAAAAARPSWAAPAGLPEYGAFHLSMSQQFRPWWPLKLPCLLRQIVPGPSLRNTFDTQGMRGQPSKRSSSFKNRRGQTESSALGPTLEAGGLRRHPAAPQRRKIADLRLPFPCDRPISAVHAQSQHHAASRRPRHLP